MEQEFLLKYYGHFSRFEMALMTAEERAWHIRRLDQENKKANQQDKIQTPSRALPPTRG
jgi:hypothetical protein